MRALPVTVNWEVVALVVVELMSESPVMEDDAFTMMPTVLEVEVGVMAKRPENCQSLALPPEPQGLPAPETKPMPEIWRHWVEPLPEPEIKRREVEAVLATCRKVVVDWVEVERKDCRFVTVDDAPPARN